ncbi:MAG: MarR family transcriptional regulator [Bacteroidia bacterium]
MRSDEELSAIYKLNEDGCTPGEISRRLGIPKSTIQSLLRKKFGPPPTDPQLEERLGNMAFRIEMQETDLETLENDFERIYIAQEKQNKEAKGRIDELFSLVNRLINLVSEIKHK